MKTAKTSSDETLPAVYDGNTFESVQWSGSIGQEAWIEVFFKLINAVETVNVFFANDCGGRGSHTESLKLYAQKDNEIVETLDCHVVSQEHEGGTSDCSPLQLQCGRYFRVWIEATSIKLVDSNPSGDEDYAVTKITELVIARSASVWIGKI